MKDGEWQEMAKTFDLLRLEDAEKPVIESTEWAWVGDAKPIVKGPKVPIKYRAKVIELLEKRIAETKRILRERLFHE